MEPTSVHAIRLAVDRDVVTARQAARALSGALGFEAQDQVRIAAAASELARGTLRLGDAGRIEFRFDRERALLQICVSEEGDSGHARRLDELAEEVVAARRVMDGFEVDQGGNGLWLSKRLPASARSPGVDELQRLRERLEQRSDPGIFGEFQRQNGELLQTLDQLRQHQTVLQQVNAELEETNRGVVALYAELEENAESLRRAIDEKSRLYSGISHELRTPINSILALAGMLIDRLDGELNDEQEKQVTLIRTAAENLRDWVNDLLDLAKVDAGRMEVTRDAFTVEDLFAGLRGMMRPLQTHPDVSLVFASPEKVPPLYNDERKVTQILRNLISNALKFTERGEVVVSTRMIEETDRIEFTVRDSGVGIAKEDQRRIFDEFVQVDGRLQRSVKGTGLGLPLSQRLAAMLGGSITLESTPGVGSTFVLDLPRQLPQAAEATEASEGAIAHPKASAEPVPETGPDGSGQPVHVLIIDDEESARYMLRKELVGLLPSLDHAIAESGRGEEGLRMAQMLRPNLIFLDLDMPDVSGYDVLDRLTQSTDGSEADIVVYSSHVPDSVDASRLTSRTLGILPKPLPSGDAGRNLLRKFLKSCGMPVGEAR